MKASIHRMEIDRIRFVLSSYLRSRLQKVSKANPRSCDLKKKQLTEFDVRLSRLKSSSHTCWRKRSPGRRASRRCFPQRSLPLPKSEYSRVKAPAVCWGNAALTRSPTHRYYSNTETYLKAVALKRMPPNLQTMDMLKAGENLPIYVFFTFENVALLLLLLLRSLTVGVVSPSWCNRSAWTFSGLFRVPAGEGDAGEHPGGAWNGRSEVTFIPLVFSNPSRWQCCGFGAVLSFSKHTETADLLSVLHQGVCCGSRRGLPASHALPNRSSTRCQRSRAANVNADVSNNYLTS